MANYIEEYKTLQEKLTNYSEEEYTKAIKETEQQSQAQEKKEQINKALKTIMSLEQQKSALDKKNSTEFGLVQQRLKKIQEDIQNSKKQIEEKDELLKQLKQEINQQQKIKKQHQRFNQKTSLTKNPSQTDLFKSQEISQNNVTTPSSPVMFDKKKIGKVRQTSKSKDYNIFKTQQASKNINNESYEEKNL